MIKINHSGQIKTTCLYGDTTPNKGTKSEEGEVQGASSFFNSVGATAAANAMRKNLVLFIRELIN